MRERGGDSLEKLIEEDEAAYEKEKRENDELRRWTRAKERKSLNFNNRTNFTEITNGTFL